MGASSQGAHAGTGTADRSSAPRAPLPAKSKAKSNFKTPGRTLGGAEPPSEDASDARRRAAEAAQKRAEAVGSAQKGKLGSKLAAQKAQTDVQALRDASRSERAARESEAAAQARRWE